MQALKVDRDPNSPFTFPGHACTTKHDHDIGCACLQFIPCSLPSSKGTDPYGCTVLPNPIHMPTHDPSMCLIHVPIHAHCAGWHCDG